MTVDNVVLTTVKIILNKFVVKSLGIVMFLNASFTSQPNTM